MSDWTLVGRHPEGPEELVSLLGDANIGVGAESWASKHRRFLIGLTSVIVALAVWQLASQVHLVNPKFTSSPSKIAVAEYHYFASSTGFADVGKTSLEFAVGFALAIVVGVPLGVAIGWYPTLAAICDPFLNLIYATPFIALTPLFVLWFGLGYQSKIAIVFLAAIISIVVTTSAGVRTVEHSLVQVARIYGASTFQIFRTLIIPGTLPSTISGIRLGTGHALNGAVLAEIVASTGGLGYTINEAGQLFNTDQLMAAVAVVAIIGLLLASLLRRVERRFDRWRIA
jgi:ABC-type nitrate/sulfonate/bicarbonate transport system permease component